MNLSYDKIIAKKYRNITKELYKEDTNVFAYYIGVAILMINPIKFVSYCLKNNINLFRFKKTSSSVLDFYSYFINESTNAKTIEYFHEMNKIIKKTPKKLLYSCRMTISEVDIH